MGGGWEDYAQLLIKIVEGLVKQQQQINNVCIDSRLRDFFEWICATQIGKRIKQRRQNVKWHNENTRKQDFSLNTNWTSPQNQGNGQRLPRRPITRKSSRFGIFENSNPYKLDWRNFKAIRVSTLQPFESRVKDFVNFSQGKRQRKACQMMRRFPYKKGHDFTRNSSVLDSKTNSTSSPQKWNSW